MPVIDAQVHAYERNHPGRPWVGTLHGPGEVTGDQMVASMDAVGVDGAILVSPWTMYRFDASYAVEVGAAHPGRFGLVAPMDPRRDDVADAVAEWAATPGAVGVRLMFWSSAGDEIDTPGVHAVADAAAHHGLPLNTLAWGKLPKIGELAAVHPETQFIIDHVGLQQPFEPPAPPQPFADLPAVLALAARPNVAIKITGATTLAHRPFPFADLHEPLGRIFDAYGFERCLWGTDWTRATGLVTYAQGVDAFLVDGWLSDSDRATLMGGAAERIYRWSPTR
ncbi:MAG: amidohydrolase family protein [Acidimicrobiia bacterium]|nr:amidohydrolase family protein [Acidimicrobiia bacterium]